MSPKARLKALEQAVGAGVCPACGEGGTGPRQVVLLPIVLDGDPPPDDRPDPCPVCGRRPIRLNPITFDGGKAARCDDGEP